MLAARVLRSAGVGSLWGIGFLAVGLVGRMWGRTEIEWQDRSWRLLENRGQVETDDWTLGGGCGWPDRVVIAARRGMLGTSGAAAASGAARAQVLTWREVLAVLELEPW